MAGAPTPTFSVVRSPAAQPPVTGLLVSLTGDNNLVGEAELDEFGHPARWTGGFAYSPEQTCTRMPAFDPCDMVTVKSIPPNPAKVDVMPFGIGAGDACSSFGYEARDHVGRAKRALAATESASISQEFWTGAAARSAGWPNNYLASTLAAVLDVTKVSPAEALSCLEQGIAETSNGQRGMIHCTPQLGSIFSELGQTMWLPQGGNGGIIMTYRGTIINADAGNPGTGPTQQPKVSDSQWAYATLVPTVRRSQMEVFPSEDEASGSAMFRGTNLFEYWAERLAAVSFPPCTHIAVNVNVPLCGGGS